MENNLAFVGTLKNITKIPNADKILQADVYLGEVKITQVIVGLDTVENSKVVYFDSNLCLSQKLINDYSELSRYLGKHYRVKAVKLKGIISNGLCVEVDKFYRYFKNNDEAVKTLIEGYSFDKINDIEICKKYVPVINITGQIKGKKKGRKGKISTRMIPNQFNFHFDTSHLMKNIHRLNPDQLISISSKWHGTSGIVSKCLVKKNLNLIERALKKLGVNIVDTHYDYIYASRRVIKNGEMDVSNFYKEDIWTTAGKNFEGKLHDGETVYFEIVGYLQDGKPIQKGYDYGCLPENHRIVLYRITNTGADGNIYEYSWQAMKDRCQELGIESVKEFYCGKAKDLYPEISINDKWNVNFLERLKKEYLEKDCTFCKNKVPDEGIVLRIEGLNIESFKLKSERFVLRESEQKDNEIIDIEDIN